MPHVERHRAQRGGWLRAAVLGANDGIVSTASLVLGVAAAAASPLEVLTAGLAGLVGGSLSMAAGEYVSVASQRDTERADLRRERKELETMPGRELEELAAHYRERGLPVALALQVAEALTAHDALEAHATTELGIVRDALARPVLAATVSAASFAIGAALPLGAMAAAPPGARLWLTLGVALGALGLLGAWSARLGGAPVARATGRVLLGGALAMALTAALGALFGAAM